MRKFKKIITTVLAASIITTCTPVSIPSVSYAAGVTEYTSATDLELNKAHMITLQYKDSAGEINYTWYKFNAVPETEIEISATSLNGYGLEYYIYDSILQSVYTNGGRGTRTITLNKDTTYYIRFRSYNADNQVSMIIKGETSAPAATPTIAPIVAIEVPASGQTATPTAAPTATPTVVPTATPTVAPTATPTVAPTVTPTVAPTATPAGSSDIGNVNTDFWTEDGNTGSSVYDNELPVPEIKEVANNSKSIDITWSCSSTSDIDGYYIYRSTDGKSWNKIATINDTEVADYEDTDVVNGQGYGYILRSYIEASQSENSIPAYTCFLNRIDVKSVKSNASKKLTVKWSKNDKASGYQIRISTTKSFTKTTTETTKMNSKSKSTKTIGKLKGGKKYFVQVRAYRSYNGEIYYSEWSQSKSLKVKR